MDTCSDYSFVIYIRLVTVHNSWWWKNNCFWEILHTVKVLSEKIVQILVSFTWGNIIFVWYNLHFSANYQMTGLSTFDDCLAWGTKTWKKKFFNILQFFLPLRQSNCVWVNKKKWHAKKRVMFSLMREILHAWCECVRSSLLASEVWDSSSVCGSWQPCRWGFVPWTTTTVCCTNNN